MFAPDDTIVAVATPPGRGAIGLVRISGSRALDLTAALLNRSQPLEPRRATFARLGATDGLVSARDEVIVTWFPAPHSYTGQDVVEIGAHGSPVVVDAIVRMVMDAGARLAMPGEFTLRAFLNGKRDLVQAEAVADLIAAATPLQARVAFDQLEGTLSERIAGIDAPVFDLVVRLEASLDFPDEGYHFVRPGETVEGIDRALAGIDALLSDEARGRMIREGATVVVAGRPNVGKSSLFNALVGTARAIVTEVPGTTRDLVTERLDLKGIEVTLVDTAGARETVDVVEREGVVRASRASATADLVLVVIDMSEPLTNDDVRLLEETAGLTRLVVANKCDKRAVVDHATVPRVAEACRVSAMTGENLEVLRSEIAVALTGGESLRDTASISNTRHIELLRQTRRHLVAARDAAAVPETPEECVLVDLHAARGCLDEIVGARTTDDILDQVFARFCIGK